MVTQKGDVSADHSDDALSLNQLAISYAKSSLWNQLFGGGGTPPATVDNINISIRTGETLGLVGESGSGKSTILKAIAGLISPKTGHLVLNGKARLAPKVEDRPALHLRQIQMIFQNPDDSLNPRHTIAQIPGPAPAALFQPDWRRAAPAQY